MSPSRRRQIPIIKQIAPFLDYCEIEKGLSNNTQKNYWQYLRLFVGWLKKTGREKLLPREFTAQHIWDYRLYLARKYKTPAGNYLGKKSQNYYLIALRALLAYFAEHDIESLPSSKIKLAKQKNDASISFLEIHEVEKILKVPDTRTQTGLRDRAVMEVFFSSGMRLSELVSLNVGQMSFLRDEDSKKTFELPIVGKGKYVRTVFISPRASRWLRTYLAQRVDDDNALFINFRSKNPEYKRLSTRHIQMMISKYASLAGLSKKVTPHTFRHTYATDLLSHGADLRSVQELLGHKNVATTQVYTHVTNRRLRDVHEKFHGGGAISENSSDYTYSRKGFGKGRKLIRKPRF
ncbi:MAG: tyrosine-type recombinase/integrase [Candidatus Doudnabacteria bacterium]|nr:tyrosine-type recombinase/integrase [Candidatus Doudnabacteria bacterium]MBI4363429.1 tyrosine-type recombinase/integrase [Candidatus Doudnabacteria bacterium]